VTQRTAVSRVQHNGKRPVWFEHDSLHSARSKRHITINRERQGCSLILTDKGSTRSADMGLTALDAKPRVEAQGAISRVTADFQPAYEAERREQRGCDVANHALGEEHLRAANPPCCFQHRRPGTIAPINDLRLVDWAEAELTASGPRDQRAENRFAIEVREAEPNDAALTIS